MSSLPSLLGLSLQHQTHTCTDRTRPNHRGGMFLFQVLSKYLQHQDIIMPSVIIGIVVNVFGILLEYLLVYQLQLGLDGAALGISFIYLSMALAHGIYIKMSRKMSDNWGGWTSESLQHWGQFCSLGLPGILMICLEWYCYEVSVILAGTIGPVELGSQSVSYMTWGIFYAVQMGLSFACAIRLGQALGAGDAIGAKVVAWVSYALIVSVSCVLAAAIAALRYQIPRIFTGDEEIINMSADILPVTALYILIGGVVTTGIGVFRGCGRQLFGSIVTIIVYLCIGLPLGIPAMLSSYLKDAGFWWGMVAAVAVESAIFLFTTLRTDWAKQVDIATRRTHADHVGQDTSEEGKRLLDEHNAGCGKFDAYNEKVNLGMESAKYKEWPRKPHAEDKRRQSGHLSITQLILRRGGAILMLILILLAGVLIRENIGNGDLDLKQENMTTIDVSHYGINTSSFLIL